MIDIARLHECLTYDAETGAFIWRKSLGNLHFKGRVAGGLDKDGYVRIRLDGHSHLGHRLAWFFYYGVWPDAELDHIDRNRANNSITNLRPCNHSQNCLNKSVQGRKRNTKLKGVFYFEDLDRRHVPWIASITINGKSKTLGRFRTEAEAHSAYLNAVSSAPDREFR